MFRVSLPWSAQQQPYLSYLAKFTSSIVHVPGPENAVADAPYRPSPDAASSISTTSSLVSLAYSASTPPLPSVEHHFATDSNLSSFDISFLPTLQLSYHSVSEMMSKPSLSMVYIPLGDASLLCDVSSGSLCQLVPLQLCHQVFNILHNSSHPGIRASRRLVSSRFVWPGLSRDMGLWAKSCLQCQWSKIQNHVHSCVLAIPVPSCKFSHIFSPAFKLWFHSFPRP